MPWELLIYHFSLKICYVQHLMNKDINHSELLLLILDLAKVIKMEKLLKLVVVLLIMLVRPKYPRMKFFLIFFKLLKLLQLKVNMIIQLICGVLVLLLTYCMFFKNFLGIFIENSFSLCGFSPFLSSTQHGLFDKIVKCEYDFPDPEWTTISANGKFPWALLVTNKYFYSKGFH